MENLNFKKPTRQEDAIKLYCHSTLEASIVQTRVSVLELNCQN